MAAAKARGVIYVADPESGHDDALRLLLLVELGLHHHQRDRHGDALAVHDPLAQRRRQRQPVAPAAPPRRLRGRRGCV